MYTNGFLAAYHISSPIRLSLFSISGRTLIYLLHVTVGLRYIVVDKGFATSVFCTGYIVVDEGDSRHRCSALVILLLIRGDRDIGVLHRLYCC